jgi:hypothetical protein
MYRASCQLSRLAVLESAIENVAKCDILEAAEASDWSELPHVDVAVGYAQAGSTWKYTTSPSYKRVAVWAELNHLVELALQMNRHLGDARHFDLHGRHLRQPSLMEFAFLLRKGVGGIYRHREECLLEGLAKKPAGPIRHGLGVVHRAAKKTVSHITAM